MGGVSAVVVIGFAAFAVARDFRRVRLQDRCEPDSFNAAVGAGTCVGDGNITFERFIEELTEEQEVGAWNFDRDEVELDSGEPLKLQNTGGEVHSFTTVAQFGGGFVPDLNALSGTPVPAPECATVAGNGALVPQPPSPTNIFLGPGQDVFVGSGRGTVFPKGTHLVQCCIHPWMRTTVHVR
jgi:hypothetical protein